MSDLYKNDAIREQAERIVRNNVTLCVSSLIHNAAQTENGAEMLDIDTDEMWGLLARQRFIASDGTEFDNMSDAEDYALEEELEDAEIEEEYSEAYEHWAVSSWFARALGGMGEAVCDSCLGMIWGRCTTGQGIAMDDVVLRIARDFLAEHNPASLEGGAS